MTMLHWRFIGLIGLGIGIVYLLGKMTESHPDPNAKAPKAPVPLALGAKAPTLIAEGWLNGPPPSMQNKNVRAMVVDVWGHW
jgi:hypothetical protein